jgi:GNAT superfamily N-acetyltransferase
MITLGNTKYNYLIGYQHDDRYRLSFNALAQSIFPISFEEWYQSGYWKDKYIPYTLFDGDRAIANASVNIMDFNSLGQKKRYIQIGTVMTDPAYRNKGLSRFLMLDIIKKWNEKCDFIYLFANSTALEFYPKLGFEPVKEYEYFKSVNSKISANSFEKLNMDNNTNREKLYDYAKNSRFFGKLSMQENADLVLFDCITFLKDNVYYNKSLDVIVITTFNENQLCLWDIFSKNDVELESIVNALMNSEIKELVLGFTPTNSESYLVREASGPDVLFIQKEKTSLFYNNKLMFPLLSHA